MQESTALETSHSSTGSALSAVREVLPHPDDLRHLEAIAREIERYFIVVEMFDRAGTGLDHVANENPHMKRIPGTPAVADLTEHDDLASRRDFDFRTLGDRGRDLKAQAGPRDIEHGRGEMPGTKGHDPDGNRIVARVSRLAPFFCDRRRA